MRRDAKGRFTKALAKTKPQPTTDVKLERKLARIEQTEAKIRTAKRFLLLEVLLVLGFTGLVATGWVAGSVSVGGAGLVGAIWRARFVYEANQRYLKYRATHQRLLQGANSLSAKLLAEEGIGSDI